MIVRIIKTINFNLHAVRTNFILISFRFFLVLKIFSQPIINFFYLYKIIRLVINFNYFFLKLKKNMKNSNLKAVSGEEQKPQKFRNGLVENSRIELLNKNQTVKYVITVFFTNVVFQYIGLSCIINKKEELN